MKSFDDALEQAREDNLGTEQPQDKPRASTMLEGLLSGLNKISAGIDAVHAGTETGGALGAAMALDQHGTSKGAKARGHVPDPDGKKEVWDDWAQRVWNKSAAQRTKYNNDYYKFDAETKKWARLVRTRI